MQCSDCGTIRADSGGEGFCAGCNLRLKNVCEGGDK
jgi:hypothetical protein